MNWNAIYAMQPQCPRCLKVLRSEEAINTQETVIICECGEQVKAVFWLAHDTLMYLIERHENDCGDGEL